jgi:hypothetical protein
MTVRLCGLLHELFNPGSKVHIKKFVCLLPAWCNVMRARLCCSCISNCEGLFAYTIVVITCFIFCVLFIVWNNNLCLSDISVLINWGWKDSCTNIPRGDLSVRIRRPGRLVATGECEPTVFHLVFFPFGELDPVGSHLWLVNKSETH